MRNLADLRIDATQLEQVLGDTLSGPFAAPSRRTATLALMLLGHRLADEVLLIVYPVLLGTGKHFPAEGTPARAFELVSTKALPSGVIFNAYRAAGSLKTA